MTVEDEARELLKRVGVENVSSFSSGDLVEIANLIQNFNLAIGALADIAFSDDLSEEARRKKAKRIYEQIKGE